MTKPDQDASSPADVHHARSWSATAGAALLGVVLGGVFSLIGVLLTNHAFDQRTQRDFLHQQRQSAFTAMLGDEHQTSAEELTVSIAVAPKGTGFGTVAQTYTAMVTKLSTDAAEIRLVAGDQAYQVASKVAADHSQILMYYLHLAQCHYDKTTDCPAQAELNGNLHQLTIDTDSLVAFGSKAIGAH